MASVTALQLLPLRQRAVLILRDVLGQPAFAVYFRDPVNGVTRAFGLLVVTLAGDRISVITRFGNTALPYIGLPRTLVG